MARGARRRITVRRRLAVGLGIVLALLLVLGIASAFYLRSRFESNIEKEPFLSEEVTGVERPLELPSVKGALNILVMGSDTREGANGKGIGSSDATPGLSDTTILLHIAEDRSFAYGVSIPRDSMVERPACPRKNGSGVDPGGFTQFNQAYAIGGPACTVATVEQATNVRIHHFAVVDFAGFRSMVNAVGGVRMCVPEDVNDEIGKIHLKAGTYNMDGDTALDYVRVRHGIGVELGDIGRMKRQQAFVAALASKIMASGTLANPVKLVKLMESATKSLTTDPGLADLMKLAGLASSLQDIGVDRVRFVTVPFTLWPEDPNRIVWTSDADTLWTSMAEDRRLPKSLSESSLTTTGPKITEPTENNEPPVKAQDPTDKYKNLSEAERASYGLC